ncbi:iron-sulfur cluster assembly scaffold protein [Candidatus Bipolaricaulota bacterium]|nr:iron-sulfur cluster assembly scaffold protein [Candidatus Bipolaricaulota bacterium]HBR10049.1 iron-sulfur cluster assembly scaffold protein [Candidatus Acetothermia bacterium]
MYSEKVIDHFRNPHNKGKLDEYSAIGKVGNIVCGDVMWLYIKVGRNANNEEIIEDISWETFGCTAAIATSSMVTELAKGKTLKEATAINNQEVAETLGGLPPIKMHCSLLAVDALSEAIYNYLQEKGDVIPESLVKRHAHIEKEHKELAERYSDYI